MEMYIALAAAVVLALLLSAVLTPLVIRVSHRRQWYDIPNERKVHTDPIPRLGGVAIFIAAMVAAIAVPFCIPLLLPGVAAPSYSLRYLLVFEAFAIIFAAGLVDDFYNLRAILKFLLQLLAAALVTFGGFLIAEIRIPGLGTLALGVFAYPVTVLWIVAISNAINLVDGVDGLAGGIGGIAALSMAAMFMIQGRPIPALIAVSLLGAISGFLFSNFPPAKIFMGDSGALFIGFTLAVIPLLGAARPTTIGDLFAPATVLLIPILDTTTAIVRRLREHRAIYSPDRQHIHHKLLALGLKERSILLIVYAFCAGFGLAAIASQFMGRLASVLVLVGVWALTLIAYSVLHTRNTAIARRPVPAPRSLR
jgi:UDP-GlcNAc:undecaprenyl-phosphate GlcNAc-1-phosphate transferase